MRNIYIQLASCWEDLVPHNGAICAVQSGINGPGEPLQSSQEERGTVGKYDIKSFLLYFTVKSFSGVLESKQSDQTNPYTLGKNESS